MTGDPKLRIIALEEHYRAPMVREAFASGVLDLSGDEQMQRRFAKLDDLDAGRIADMDAAGVDVQVLSHVAPDPADLDPARGIPLARQANDYLAARIARHPERLAAFATLPLADPSAAADELRRSVRELGSKGALINGHVGGHFLDEPRFAPVFEAAVELDVPLYLHPSPPPAAVREAYYSGLPPLAAEILATAGWGWHVDTGMHALRLVLAGTFERFERLQIIIGHMGEGLPFFLARSARLFRAGAGLSRSLEQCVAENFHITTSGVFTIPPLLCSLLVLGPERVMFSIDYPFADDREACAFIRDAPLSPDTRAKIAHGNAARLLGV